MSQNSIFSKTGILLLIAGVLLLPHKGFALSEVEKGERAAGKKADAAVIAQPNIEKYQDKSEEVYALLKEISDGLSDKEKKHFYTMYNNYNLVGTVKMVQTDVGNAIDACSTANPDMESDLRARFQKWNDAVGPIVGDAEAHIENMVAAQEYAKPKKIDLLFDAVDETRTFTNKQVKKTPVTTPDACSYLLDKMSDTQRNLTRLLRETLVSVPVEPEAEPVQKEPVEKELLQEKPEAKDSKAE